MLLVSVTRIGVYRAFPGAKPSPQPREGGDEKPAPDGHDHHIAHQEGNEKAKIEDFHRIE